jgi:hypothetical protein
VYRFTREGHSLCMRAAGGDPFDDGEAAEVVGFFLEEA